jgi:hypothetical protein
MAVSNERKVLWNVGDVVVSAQATFSQERTLSWDYGPAISVYFIEKLIALAFGKASTP